MMRDILIGNNVSFLLAVLEAEAETELVVRSEGMTEVSLTAQNEDDVIIFVFEGGLRGEFELPDIVAPNVSLSPNDREILPKAPRKLSKLKNSYHPTPRRHR